MNEKPRVLDDEERQMNNYLISQVYYYADSAKDIGQIL